MLGGAAAGGHVVAHGHREASGDDGGVEVGRRRHPRRRDSRGLAAEQHSVPPRSPRHRAGSSAASSGLTRISGPASCSIWTVRLHAGPVAISSRCGEPTRKKWNVPVCTPTDMRSRTLTPGSSMRPTSRRDRRIHTADRQANASWSSPWKSSRGVAAELDQAAPVRVRDREQVRETSLDRLRDLLSAFLALLGEALRQLGEPRDVDEHDGAVDGPRASLGVLGELAQQQPRHVGGRGSASVVEVGGGRPRRDDTCTGVPATPVRPSRRLPTGRRR